MKIAKSTKIREKQLASVGRLKLFLVDMNEGEPVLDSEVEWVMSKADVAPGSETGSTLQPIRRHRKRPTFDDSVLICDITKTVRGAGNI